MCLFFEKLFLNFFCVYLLFEKLVNEKQFLVKKNFDLVFKKVFSFYFGRKTLSKNYEKFRNVIILNLVLKLLIYIYIYLFIVLNIYLLILSIRI